MGYKQDLGFGNEWCNEWNKQDLHGAEQLPLMLDIWRACCERKLIFQKYTKGTNPFPHPQSTTRLAWLKLVFDFVCKNSSGFAITFAQAGLPPITDYQGAGDANQPLLSLSIETDDILYPNNVTQTYSPAGRLNFLSDLTTFPVPKQMGYTVAPCMYNTLFDMITTYSGEEDSVGYVVLLRAIKAMLCLSVYMPDETFPVYDDKGVLTSNDLLKTYGSILDGQTSVPFVDERCYYEGYFKHVVSLTVVAQTDGLYKIAAMLGGSEGNILSNLLKVDFTNLLTYK